MRHISTERLVGPKPNLRTSAAWPCDPDSVLCGDRGLTIFDWANLGLTAHLLLNRTERVNVVAPTLAGQSRHGLPPNGQPAGVKAVRGTARSVMLPSIRSTSP